MFLKCFSQCLLREPAESRRRHPAARYETAAATWSCPSAQAHQKADLPSASRCSSGAPCATSSAASSDVDSSRSAPALRQRVRICSAMSATCFPAAIVVACRVHGNTQHPCPQVLKQVRQQTRRVAPKAPWWRTVHRRAHPLHDPPGRLSDIRGPVPKVRCCPSVPANSQRCLSTAR